MAEYIEREATLNVLRNLGNRDYRREKGTIVDAMKMIMHSVYTPAADVAEVKHGKWIENECCDISCVCSVCGAEANYTSRFKETFDYDWEENLQSTGYEEIKEYIRTPYCSNCGARMDGEGE